MQTDQLADVVSLQRTLYSSRNPTRRWLHTRRRDAIFAAIRTVPVPDADCALEVGPGSGVYLPELCRRFTSVTAIDIEDHHLNEIEETFGNLHNLRLIKGDICNCETLKEFDLVLCSEVIEHVPDPRMFMAAIARAVRLGGYLILSTPQPWSVMEVTARVALSDPFIRFTRWVYREPVLPTGHISVQSGKRLRSLLRENGFEIIEPKYFGFYFPVVAEFGGNIGASVLQSIERLIRRYGPRGVLWTQLYVARKFEGGVAPKKGKT